MQVWHPPISTYATSSVIARFNLRYTIDNASLAPPNLYVRYFFCYRKLYYWQRRMTTSRPSCISVHLQRKDLRSTCRRDWMQTSAHFCYPCVETRLNFLLNWLPGSALLHSACLAVLHKNHKLKTTKWAEKRSERNSWSQTGGLTIVIRG
jgi:hypothetical protein